MKYKKGDWVSYYYENQLVAVFVVVGNTNDFPRRFDSRGDEDRIAIKCLYSRSRDILKVWDWKKDELFILIEGKEVSNHTEEISVRKTKEVDKQIVVEGEI